MKKSKATNVLRTPARLVTWFTAAVAMVLALAVTSRTDARPTPPPLEDPAHWATITHPGNAPFVFQEPGAGLRSVGAVNYEYQISKTEVTTAEWLEFVNAYAPYVTPADRTRPRFTSQYVFVKSGPSGGPYTYFAPPIIHDFGAEVGWRYAARYCNWLHNGKVNEAWAFESGAYDTSTFTDNADGSFNDQRTRSPGARYAIPTEDEWVKAAFFDPNKHGPNQPGYWLYNTTSDTEPPIGAPGVGQTNAGSGDEYASGAYADVTSPWGLLDTSSGNNEWMENAFTPSGSTLPRSRLSRGSGWAWPQYYDRIERWNALNVIFSGSLRLVRPVPTPGAVSGVCLLGAYFTLSRRRKAEPHAFHASSRSLDPIPRGQRSHRLGRRHDLREQPPGDPESGGTAR